MTPGNTFFRYFLASVALLLALSLLYAPVVLSEENDAPEEDYILEIESEFGLVTDPGMVNRVTTIADNILDVIPEAQTDEREITVKVLDEDSINAFALPDGHVYFFRGLVEACETDDMLAGVMAHEFTHVFHRHHSRMSDRQMRGMLIGIGAMLATGEEEGLILAQILSASMVETYGRSAENDADATGVTWAVAAGYDPVGFIELMQILEQQSIHRPEPGGNYFTVHPHPDERLANIRDTLSALGIELPDIIYRVHMPIIFYEPLSEQEAQRLDAWESGLVRRAESGGENAGDHTADGYDPDLLEVEEPASAEDLPVSLVTEYTLRRELFSDITVPDDVAAGVIAVNDSPVFYITADDDDALSALAQDIISRLGDKFFNGLRSYEVQGRTIDETPALLADRRVILYATQSDADLLGTSRDELNNSRIAILKDLLYRYYVNRRI